MIINSKTYGPTRDIRLVTYILLNTPIQRFKIDFKQSFLQSTLDFLKRLIFAFSKPPPSSTRALQSNSPTLREHRKENICMESGL